MKRTEFTMLGRQDRSNLRKPELDAGLTEGYALKKMRLQMGGVTRESTRTGVCDRKIA
jgi:hypothetical protein